MDVWPSINFIKNYMNINVSVPRPPYPEGLLWNETVKCLKKKHSIVIGPASNDSFVEWGNLVKVHIVNAYKSSFLERNKGNLFQNQQYFCGEYDIQVEESWNPYGLCEGLIGMKRNQDKFVYVEVPRAENILHNDSRNCRNMMGNEAENNLSIESIKRDVDDTKSLESEICEMEEQECLLFEKYKFVYPVILHIKCVDILKTTTPILNDDFFKKLCNMTFNEAYQIVERTGIPQIEERCVNQRRSAILQEILKCVSMEIPDTLIKHAGFKMWESFIIRKKIEKRMSMPSIVMNKSLSSQVTEDNSQLNAGMEDKIEYILGNYESIERQVRLAIALRSICKLHSIKFDTHEIPLRAAYLKFVLPDLDLSDLTENLYRTKETEAVLDWIARYARVSYYVDHSPLRVKVELQSYNNQSNVVHEMAAFPLGANETEYWHTLRKKESAGNKTLYYANLLKP